MCPHSPVDRHGIRHFPPTCTSWIHWRNYNGSKAFPFSSNNVFYTETFVGGHLLTRTLGTNPLHFMCTWWFVFVKSNGIELSRHCLYFPGEIDRRGYISVRWFSEKWVDIILTSHWDCFHHRFAVNEITIIYWLLMRSVKLSGLHQNLPAISVIPEEDYRWLGIIW